MLFLYSTNVRGLVSGVRGNQHHGEHDLEQEEGVSDEALERLASGDMLEVIVGVKDLKPIEP